VFFDITIDKENVGKIIMELFNDITPNSAKNFKALCTGENGIGKIYNKPLHFKGTQFHRIIPDYMAQAGDIVNQNGIGGECIWGERFPDENFVRKHIGCGIMSYANKGRHTNASQFFYSLTECPWLDGQYVVFGQVLDGFDILDTMAKKAGSISGQTKQKVVIADCGVLKLEEER
jgi:peptidylprolyl isomerase